MAEAAAHLVDHVFPEVPVRQWVISFPWRLRFLLALDPRLCRAVRKVFLRAGSLHRSPRITDAEVAKLLFTIRSRVLRLCRRCGLINGEDGLEVHGDDEQGLLPHQPAPGDHLRAFLKRGITKNRMLKDMRKDLSSTIGDALDTI